MQVSDMRAFRSIHLCKTLQTISTGNPNPIITCCRSRNNPLFTKKSHRRFLSTATADESSTASSWSAFPNSQPPADSASPKTPTVQTIYDPTTGRVVTKREYNVSKEVEKSESTPPAVDVGSRVYGDVIGSSSARSSSMKKKGKSRSVHVCESCGYSDGQWWGTCKQCGEVGTMKRFTTESVDRKVSGMQVSENAVRSWLPKDTAPVKLTDVYGRIDDSNWRIPLSGLFGAEVERVLGGGLVPGSLVLVGGDPGVGKSTLLLQIAALITEGKDANIPGRVIYVSGEESVEQIANRADRLSIETDELFLHSSTDIEDILEHAQHLSPRALIIDSIQTVYLRGVTGSAGGDVQVKECTSALLRFAKKTNIPVLLIGHVTKTGDIAGPRVLEHIVDVVLYMEGEKYSSHRLLRSVKNRFGSTDELGVFKMSRSGLEGLSNPSEMFLVDQHSDSDYLAGLAIAVIVDGSRAFLIEIQALCVAGSSVVRHLNGVQGSRADMIISVIIKQAGLKLQENGIFLNVVSGVSLTETAGDLAIAAAICSSFLEFPIPNGVAFIAEIGLGGELRMVPQLEKRINTLAKLGYKKCIVPKSAEKSLSDLQPHGMEILGCKNLKEMINTVFVRS
ncbi:hypothetical protein ABFS82_09G111800 [Erythranthe guttata]|uniref:uncharacterized protein LOC105975650 n=1 Tax=Erythranthe guttata TaxID=4155 RepID=UPI00064DDF21|nr:PREDICTED: uncharacterized protein LOC105975650 [Erythranthe guttata]|eukprot:XP_012856297.1 PREDICTED: uncharacterized protein LOC105975650 [Erythranthe guttata]